jgi:hypothetical protein
MIDRQVRYYRSTTTGEQEAARHKWTFLIINEPREINRIRERVYNGLYEIVNLKQLYDEPIQGSDGLHFQVFSFSSSKGIIEEPNKIYRSKKFKLDRDLRTLENGTDVECESYLRAILEGRK